MTTRRTPVIIEVKLHRSNGNIGNTRIGDARIIKGPPEVIELGSRSLLDLTVALACAGYRFTVRPVYVSEDASPVYLSKNGSEDLP